MGYATVYSGLDVTAKIALTEETGTSISSSGTTIISNTDYISYAPKVEISNASITTGLFLANNTTGAEVEALESISGTEVVLDFANQVYTSDGTDISDKISLNQMFYIEEGNNEIFGDFTGSGVLYEKGISDDYTIAYIENMTISMNKRMRSRAQYLKKEQNNIPITKEYNVSIGKVAADWDFITYIEGDTPFNIVYQEEMVDFDRTDGHSQERVLIDVIIEDYNRQFSEDELISESIFGTAENFI